jgi:hypothetical protein
MTCCISFRDCCCLGFLFRDCSRQLCNLHLRPWPLDRYTPHTCNFTALYWFIVNISYHNCLISAYCSVCNSSKYMHYACCLLFTMTHNVGDPARVANATISFFSCCTALTVVFSYVSHNVDLIYLSHNADRVLYWRLRATCKYPDGPDPLSILIIWLINSLWMFTHASRNHFSCMIPKFLEVYDICRFTLLAIVFMFC